MKSIFETIQTGQTKIEKSVKYLSDCLSSDNQPATTVENVPSARLMSFVADKDDAIDSNDFEEGIC